MKKIIILSFLIMNLFASCKSENPTADCIVGKWIARDGAIFQFNEKGFFSTKDLPKDKFLPFSEDFTESLFSETGKWELKRDQDRWVVHLYFDSSESLPGGCVTQIYIAGSKGIMENQPPWYLFFWENEEGGSRYTFIKKE